MPARQILGCKNQAAPGARDHNVAGSKMLHAVIDDRAHAFGYSDILDFQALDAGIAFVALHFPINEVVVGRIGLQTPTPVPIARVGEIFVAEAYSRRPAKQGLLRFIVMRRQNKRLRADREEHRVLVVHGYKRSEDRIVAKSCGRCRQN
jgi:hypothetical protein